MVPSFIRRTMGFLNSWPFRSPETPPFSQNFSLESQRNLDYIPIHNLIWMPPLSALCKNCTLHHLVTTRSDLVSLKSLKLNLQNRILPHFFFGTCKLLTINLVGMIQSNQHLFNSVVVLLSSSEKKTRWHVWLIVERLPHKQNHFYRLHHHRKKNPRSPQFGNSSRQDVLPL